MRLWQGPKSWSSAVVSLGLKSTDKAATRFSRRSFGCGDDEQGLSTAKLCRNLLDVGALANAVSWRLFAQAHCGPEQKIPITLTTQLGPRRLLSLVGAKRDIDRAVAVIGYADWPSNATDMIFVGTGIFIGGLVGLLTVTIAGLPITLTASGGALIMGLVFGWLRSVFPAFGRIPEAAMWVFDTVGLSVFIGVVGLSAGPSFIAGLQKSGISLVFVGLVAAVLPHIVAILFGRYVLTMNPVILLGACSGRGHDDRRPARDSGRGTKQAPSVGLHGSLCGRQHCAHRLGARHCRLDVGGEVNMQSDTGERTG